MMMFEIKIEIKLENKTAPHARFATKSSIEKLTSNDCVLTCALAIYIANRAYELRGALKEEEEEKKQETFKALVIVAFHLSFVVVFSLLEIIA